MAHALFEGPEKKVELVLKPGSRSLRERGRPHWEAIVAEARASIVSAISTESLDAYLLSESSLFVYDDRATMITCGRTRLIDAALAMLASVETDEVALVVYERKNEHFPERQPTTFLEDAARLDAVMPGAAHRFGAEHDHRIEVFASAAADYQPAAGDVTIEVLMHGLDAGAASKFATGPIAERSASALGLEPLLQGFEIDEYAFEPAGYSLNGVRGDRYITVHVTPEEEGSYASFETNCDFAADPVGLIARVIEPFAPESVDVIAFVPGGEPIDVELDGYIARRHVAARLAGYQVSFASLFSPRGRQAPTSLKLR